jgi:hypothetical protein
MNLEGIARAVERHLAHLSEPAQLQQNREQIGKLLGLGATGLILLLPLTFFLNLALVTITGVGISEAAFGKIAIAVMALALPVLFIGISLWLLPAIRKELLKGVPTNWRRAAQATENHSSLVAQGSSPKTPADRFDAIASVTEYTTAELKPQPPHPDPKAG